MTFFIGRHGDLWLRTPEDQNGNTDLIDLGTIESPRWGRVPVELHEELEALQEEYAA